MRRSDAAGKPDFSEETKLTSWGAINAVLNRLVREGVIEAFRTNIADRRSALGLHVIVTAPDASDRADEVRQQVARALDPVIADAVVTVDQSALSREPAS
jgi:DNA-binding Lrp family transcriptional regulator